MNQQHNSIHKPTQIVETKSLYDFDTSMRADYEPYGIHICKVIYEINLLLLNANGN